MKKTKPKRTRYKNILNREKKIAKARYGSSYYPLRVKKSAAAKYRKTR